MLDPVTANQLIWYYSVGTGMFSRSTLGPMLDHAEVRAVDSAGKRLPPPRRSWDVMPIKHTVAEPSYTPNEEGLVLVARLSRRLRQIPHRDEQVLELYYGDVGALWTRSSFGRLFALFMATDSGRRFCEHDVRRNPLSMRADQRIARLARRAVGTSKHAASLRAQLAAMRLQATALLEHAEAAWKAVA